MGHVSLALVSVKRLRGPENIHQESFFKKKKISIRKKKKK